LFLLMMLALGACGAVPLSSLLPLSRIDFRTTDLAVLRVAVSLPPPLRPRPGGVMLDVETRISGQPDRKDVFRLVEDQGAAAAMPPAAPGRVMQVFRLSSSDLSTLDRLRTDAYAAQAQGKAASIAMGIAAKEFCHTAPLPAVGPLPVSVFLLTSELGRFVPVVADSDLRSGPEMAGALATLGPCN
jgi:hypothetical protein